MDGLLVDTEHAWFEAERPGHGRAGRTWDDADARRHGRRAADRVARYMVDLVGVRRRRHAWSSCSSTPWPICSEPALTTDQGPTPCSTTSWPPGCRAPWSAPRRACWSTQCSTRSEGTASSSRSPATRSPRTKPYPDPYLAGGHPVRCGTGALHRPRGQPHGGGRRRGRRVRRRRRALRRAHRPGPPAAHRRLSRPSSRPTGSAPSSRTDPGSLRRHRLEDVEAGSPTGRPQRGQHTDPGRHDEEHHQLDPRDARAPRCPGRRSPAAARRRRPPRG